MPSDEIGDSIPHHTVCICICVFVFALCFVCVYVEKLPDEGGDSIPHHVVSTAHRRTELARRSQKANQCTNLHVSSYAVSVCGGDGNNFDWDLVMALSSFVRW